LGVSSALSYRHASASVECRVSALLFFEYVGLSSPKRGGLKARPTSIPHSLLSILLSHFVVVAAGLPIAIKRAVTLSRALRGMLSHS
jgi:hypothetical protein